jgi:hypothetical protein
VDPLLKQVDAKHPGLTMFGRKDDKYVNMAVIVDSTRTLTWFTCRGQAFDVCRLTDIVYIGSNRVALTRLIIIRTTFSTYFPM